MYSIEKDNYRALYLQAKALVNLEKTKEAIVVIKKALNIKQSKTLLNYLHLLEKTLDVVQEDKTNEIEEMESEKNNNSENYTKFRILKFIKIILYYAFHTIRKNKLLFAILLSFSGYLFKNEVQRMFDGVLSIVKFK